MHEMQFTPLSDLTHLSASFYLNSAQVPFPEVNVVCRLQAATMSPDVAVEYTGALFDALCDVFDADLLGGACRYPRRGQPASVGYAR